MCYIFAVPKREYVLQKRELSSVGSEHLPYKQGVAGSNPAVPTKTSLILKWCFFLHILH